MGVPFAGGILVLFQGSSDMSGNETADHYHVYASTTSNPGPTNNVLSATVRAGTNHAAIMEPLIDGTGYYFAVAAINNSVESPVGTTSAQVTSGAPAGGFNVSGTVDLTGFASPGPLYVVMSTGHGGSLARIASPSGIQSFTIPGVPSGFYTLDAILDADRSGELGPTDPNTFRHLSPQVYVSVNGADVTGLQIRVPPSDGLAASTSRHDTGSISDVYRVELRAGPNTKLAVQARALPTRSTPATDLGVPDFGLDNSFQLYASFLTTPASGDRYVYEVSYSDGTTCNLTSAVSELVALPTGILPSGTGGTVPTFSWTAPNPPPAGMYAYRLYVQELATRNQVWSWDPLPASTTSVVYNSDPTHSASQPALTPGVQYQWSITVMDADLNEAQATATFTAQ
jgi:hypothetical protein